MPGFDPYKIEFKPYPVREYIASDRFGNHIFYFKFYPACMDVFDDNGILNPNPCIFSDWETSLQIDFEEDYPAVWQLLLELLQFDLDDVFFSRTIQEMFKVIQQIPGVEKYYFPKQLLKDGYINWNRYDIYERFQNREEGFDLRDMIDHAITKNNLPLYHWYLTIVHDAQQYKQTEISKGDFEKLIGNNEPLVIEYVDLYKLNNSKFYIIKDREGEHIYTLCTMTANDKPVLFFLTTNKGEPLP